MTRATADWVGNLIVFAIVVLVNVLSNTLPINGQSMPEISAKYPSLFTPAGFTFSIWVLIYLCLLVFVIWQALPAQRNNARITKISKYFQANCLLNAAWLILWHHDEVALSVVFMFAILATLVLIYRALFAESESATRTERLVLFLPFSLYTGWITLATIANVSVLQTANGWDDVGLAPVEWTLLKLALAGAIGATMILRFRDPVFAAVIAWGAYGISVMQSATPEVSGSAISLSLLMIFLIVKDGASRLIGNKP